MTRIPFACPRPVDVLALGGLAHDVAVSALEAPDRQALAARGLAAPTSLEEVRGVRRAWSSAHLDLVGHRDGLRYDAVAGRDSRLGSARATVDDKIEARRLLMDAGLPLPQWLESPPWALNHDHLARALDVPYVVQAREGSGGARTWVCHDAAGLTRIRSLPADSTVLVSSFVAGPPVNVHCLIGDSRLIIGAASLQVVGAPELSEDPVAYCGADFGAAAERGVCSDSIEAVAAAARLAHGIGWRGILGVDLILSDRGPVLLELNPRYQASTWLLAELEAEANLVPMGELHVGAFRNPQIENPHPPIERREPLAGATVTLRATRDQSATRALRTGAYVWDGSRLTFARPTFGLAGLEENELWVDGVASLHIRKIERGAALGRLTTRASMLDSHGALSVSAKARIHAFASAIADRPVLGGAL